MVPISSIKIMTASLTTTAYSKYTNTWKVNFDVIRRSAVDVSIDSKTAASVNNTKAIE